MKKTIFITVVATLCFFFISRSQVKNATATDEKISALTVGGKVGSLEFHQVYNYKTPSMKLSDFKGKAIILDFWGVWCSTCIKYTPHMQKFQQEYKNNLMVILVDDAPVDTEQIIIDFLGKRKAEGKGITLPIVLRPPTTKALFPHTFYPHYVWVGPDGRIKAITGPEELKDENVQRLVAGLDLNLTIKEN